jgi:hypothetical protein
MRTNTEVVSTCICIGEFYSKQYIQHTVFWKSIFYACSTLEEHILCMQHFGRAYLMHAALWKIIFYACSILEEYSLCMQYFRRVYFMHAVA